MPVEPDGHGVLIHQSYKPLFVNQAWAALHGYTAPEVLSMASILPLIAPGEQARFERCIQTLVSDEGAPMREVYQGVRKDQYCGQNLGRLFGNNTIVAKGFVLRAGFFQTQPVS